MDDCWDTDQSSDFDYDQFNITDCNCTNPQHVYLEACECDYPDTPGESIGNEILAPGIIYALVFILGTVGNSLVIYVVIRYKKMRSVTNFFLASLSIADLLLLFFCIPMKYMKYLLHSWSLGGFFCWSHNYVQLLTMICSVLTLTTISVERYIAIAHPIRTIWLSSIGRAKRIVALIWILSFILAVPAAFSQKIIVSTTVKNLTASWCMKGFPHPAWEKAFALYQFIVLFLVPVATMSFCYTILGRILQKNQKGVLGDMDGMNSRKSSAKSSISIRLGSISVSTYAPQIYTNQKRQSQIEWASTNAEENTGVANQKLLLRKSSRMPDQSVKQIVQMLVSVVIIFVICWTPYLLDHLLVAFGFVCEISFKKHLRSMRMAFGIMAFSNSSINPIIYAFMSRHFRTTFMAVFCRCRRQNGDPYRRQRMLSSQMYAHQHGHMAMTVGQSCTPKMSRRNDERKFD